MPDKPISTRRPLPPAGETFPAAAPYAELHAKTNFSFLEAASHPDELVTAAAAWGQRALAITDVHSVAGVVRAHTAAKQVGLPLIIGAEIQPLDALPVLLWAPDRAAYGRLSRLLTVGRRAAEKGDCRLTFDDLAAHAEGLLAGVLLSPIAARPPEDPREAIAAVARYRELFGDRLYAVAELHCGPHDERVLERMQRTAAGSRVPLVAAGDVHYHTPDRHALQDLLTAVRLGTTVDEAGEHLFPNAERCLKPPAAMYQRFAKVPEAVRRTVEVAGRCTFSLDELRYEYPEELAPAGSTPLEHLTRLTWKGARKRYPRGIPQRVRELIEHELELISELHYEAYFLTVWDLVRFARSRNILCQGRGSAANSVVCYCLGVTSVDPERIDVLFERFVSKQRNEAPDIDVDFEHERREEVLQYVYEKYGRHRAGMTGVVITYRPRSAVRDVGKALGLSLDRVDALAKALDAYHDDIDLNTRFREAGLDPQSPLGRRLVWLVRELLGFPRHLSQHVGGMVITQGPLCELVPIENASMADRTVIQWDKDDLDELGILKVDCLALGMLTVIHRCFDLIEQHTGETWTLASVPEGDARVYKMISKGDTVGVFQIESRAQMSMLPRLRPACYYDLVIEVAIVRPGPIQGDMVHPYLRRRNGEERVSYPNDEIHQVLHKTLGVPIFQEQAMRLAVVAAGFTPGEADQLRRAMAAWRRPGLIDSFRVKLIEGMRERGLSEEYAQRVFQQLRGFGEYGFPESHAASFALLAYVSSWMKYYHPAAFTAALINSQPMGFYAPAQLVRDAQEHGVQVLPIDVNHSHWDCTLESPAASGDHQPAGDPAKQLSLRLGLRLVLGLSSAHAEAIEAARGGGPFQSLPEFQRRTQLPQPALAKLAGADAFRSLSLDRRQALWEALEQGPELPLFAGMEDDADTGPPALPALTGREEVTADYRTFGMSLRAHPMSFLREDLNAMQVLPAAELGDVPHGTFVTTAGLVLLRQRPGTAKGITFVTIEDETGQANLVIRQDVWNRYRAAALGAKALLVAGRLERAYDIIHLVAARLEDLSHRLRDVRARARNFQ